jgi:hypothetical protein
MSNARNSLHLLAITLLCISVVSAIAVGQQPWPAPTNTATTNYKCCPRSSAGNCVNPLNICASIDPPLQCAGQDYSSQKNIQRRPFNWCEGNLGSTGSAFNCISEAQFPCGLTYKYPNGACQGQPICLTWTYATEGCDPTITNPTDHQCPPN